MEDSTLRCSICAKSFSGVVPYSQHMQSAKHLKRQRQVENETLNVLPTTEEGKLFCEVCDMKFSGIIPYGQHMNGSIHNKNVRRQKLINELYADYVQKLPHETQPKTPARYNWGTGLQDVNIQSPHSSQNNTFDMKSLQEQLPVIPPSGFSSSMSTPTPLHTQLPVTPASGHAVPPAGAAGLLHGQIVSSGQATGTNSPTYSLWNEVNETASKMNIPQIVQSEGKLKGCGICGIPFFKSSEEHIKHLESDEHFIKKLMSVKNAKLSGSSSCDLGYGSIA